MGVEIGVELGTGLQRGGGVRVGIGVIGVRVGRQGCVRQRP